MMDRTENQPDPPGGRGDGDEVRAGNTNSLKSNRKPDFPIDANPETVRLLLENNLGVIILMDIDAGIIYASPSVEAVCGYMQEELAGIKCINFIFPEDAGDFSNRFGKLLLQPGKSASFETRFRHKQGHYLWMECVITNFCNQPGIRGMVATFRDISGRRQAEESLRNSQIQLNEICASIPAVVYQSVMDSDFDSELLYISEGVQSIFGFTAAEIYGNRNQLYERVHPDDLSRLQQSVKDAAVKMQPWILEHRILPKGEQLYRWVRAHAYPTKNNDGSIIWHGTITDITDRQKLAIKKEKSLALFSAMISNMQSGVLIEGANRTIFYINKNFCDIFSLPYLPETQIGSDSSSYPDHISVLVDDSAAFTLRINKIIAAREVVQQEEIPFNDGRVFERDFVPIYSSDNRYVGHMWQYRNVTLRKKAEAEVRRKEANEKAIDFVSGLMHAQNGLDEILSGIVQVCISTLGLETCNIYLVNDLNGRINKVVHGRIGENQAIILEPTAVLPEIIDLVLNSGQQQLVSGYNMDMGNGKVARSAIAVPVKGDPGIAAIICSLSQSENFFTREHADMLSRIAFLCSGRILKTGAEEKVKRSDQQYRSLLETMKEGLLQMDSHENILYTNRQFCELTGYTADELLGRRPQDFLMVGQREAADPDEQGGLQNAARGQFEITLRKKTGVLIWVSVNLSPILNDKNETIGAIATYLEITRQKEAIEQLKKSEEQYRTLIETMHEGVLYVDRNDHLLIANDRFFEMTGYEKTELKGLLPYELLLDDEGRKLVSEKTRLRIHGVSDQYELKLKKKSGSFFWALVNGTPIYDNEGVLTGTLVTMTDITQLKLNEEATRHSEERYRTLFEKNPQPILVYDRETLKCLAVNASALKCYGFTKEEFLSLSFESFSPELNLRTFTSGIDPDKSDTQVITRHIKKNGGVIDVQIHASLIFFEGKEAVFLIINDITGKKQAEETVKIQTSYFQQLYDASPFGIVMLDTEERVLNANKAFEKIFQYHVGDIKGKSISSLLSNGATAEEVRKNSVSDEPVQLETRRRRKDGQLIDVFVVGYPIIINNSLMGFYCIYSDISKRKESEVQLKVRNDELTKTNEELDRFVYSASHDLRSPLSSILGLITILEVETPDDRQTEYLKLMKNSINKLDGFIQDIIHYSRNSRMDVESERINFNTLVSEVMDGLKFMSGAEKVRVVYDIEERVEYFSDTRRITIVLNNIISNSIKYHNLEQEDPLLSIRIKTSHENAVITIEDNGEGIDEKHHEKIFDMFYRASGRSSGTGLGLYIVKEIIDKMNGSISFESEKGKGTKFIITLPNNPKGV